MPMVKEEAIFCVALDETGAALQRGMIVIARDADDFAFPRQR